MPIKGDAAFRWTAGGVITTLPLATPLFRITPAAAKTRLDAWSLSGRNREVVTFGTVVPEIRAMVRLEGDGPGLMSLLNAGMDGVELIYFPSLSEGTEYPCLMVEPSGSEVSTQRDSSSLGASGHIEIPVRLRRVDGGNFDALIGVPDWDGGGSTEPVPEPEPTDAFSLAITETVDGQFEVTATREDGEAGEDATATITAQDEGGASFTAPTPAPSGFTLSITEPSPADGSYQVAVTGGDADTDATATITAQDEGGALFVPTSGEGSAEPPGFTTVWDISPSIADGIEDDVWTFVDSTGVTNGDVSYQTRDGRDVIEFRYESGQSDGYPGGNGHVVYDAGTLDGRWNYYRFEDVWVDPSFHGHSSGVNKFAFLSLGASRDWTVLILYGSDAGPLRPTISTQGDLATVRWSPNFATTGAPNLASYASGADIATRNEYHTIEVLWDRGTVDNNDGTLIVHLDGVEIMRYEGVNLLAGLGDEYRGFDFGPVWGGLGDTVPQDMFLRCSRMYASAWGVPAVIAAPAPDAVAGTQTDTDIEVSVSSVDGVGSHTLYGHTTDLGDDPADWVASATAIQTGVSGGSSYTWGSRTPDTTYYLAVVSTTGQASIVSDVTAVTTAPARPTNVATDSVTANSATVTWVGQTGDEYAHIVFYREASDPVSANIPAGVVGAGDTWEFEVPNLDASTQYTISVAAIDGTSRLSALVNVTATTTA